MCRSLRLAPFALLLLILLPGCSTTGKPQSQTPSAPSTEPPPAAMPVEPEQPVAPPAAEPAEAPPAKPAPVEVLEPEPAPAPPPVCTPAPAPKPARPPLPKTPIPILGAVETVLFDPPGLRLEARLDTGRTGSLLDARDIHEFERDGKQWVKFRLVDRASGQPTEMSRPVLKTAGSKAAPNVRSYVVSLRIRLGTIDQFTEFVLSDRTNSRYPVVLGTRFLRDQAIVDVARQHTAAPPAK